MVVGIKLFFPSVKGNTDNLLVVPLKIVEHLKIMHGLQKSKGMSCCPVIKSVNYLNSTKNVQYEDAMRIMSAFPSAKRTAD